MTSDYDLLYSRALLYSCVRSLAFDDDHVFELHRTLGRDWANRVVGQCLNQLRGVVAISGGLREDWTALTETQIHIAPDGVRLGRFNVDASVSELRSKLDLPLDRPIACYAGSLKPWKGVPTLVWAAMRLPHITVVIVGGDEDQRTSLRKQVETVPENVELVGRVPPDDVPEYLTASDVLVVPNTGERDISAKHTSPLKVFEYLATGRPIVASDLPSLREVLDEEVARFAIPDDSDALATTLEELLDSPEALDRLGTNAAARAERYSWTNRAETILQWYQQ